MNQFIGRGVIRDGRVEVVERIDLPDGSEVVISSVANGNSPKPAETDRPMTQHEIADTLAAMDRVEPFDFTDEERASADAWERTVNEHAISNLDRGIEDIFR